MKKSTIKNLLAAIAFVAFAASISSCNKGYGCPTNFKVIQHVVQLVK